MQELILSQTVSGSGEDIKICAVTSLEHASKIGNELEALWDFMQETAWRNGDYRVAEICRMKKVLVTHGVDEQTIPKLLDTLEGCDHYVMDIQKDKMYLLLGPDEWEQI